MKLLQKHVLLVIMLCIVCAASAQERVITGTVTADKDGLPLAGVSVSVKGSTKGTSTDADGHYRITLASSNATLIFTYAGYVSNEVEVAGRTTVNVILLAENRSLDEVVVVGYGTQKKKDLTGAVSSVKTKDLIMTASPEVGSMLRGKVAGLTVKQNSAQPGGGLDILIRGAAGSSFTSPQPLFVVDGFPISELQQPGSGGRYDAGTQSILNSFNPNDIESIDVLKDASATSIYGSRAANGVVLITTKRGAEGKVRFQYSGTYSMQKYNNPFDVLPLNEWMQVRNEAGQEQWDFDNGVFPYGDKTREDVIAGGVQPYKKLYTQNAIDNVGRGTDWFDLVTRDGATLQHNISMTGGSKTTRYLLSGNVYDQQGIIKNSGFKRYSFRVNLDQDLNKYVKLGLNLTTSRIDNDNTQLGGDQWENSGIIRAAIQQGPHIEAIDEDGNYPLNPQLPLQPNPYSLLTITDKSRIERTLGNLFVDIMPISDLTIRLKAGIDRGMTRRNNYMPKTTVHGGLENGRAYIANSENDDYLLEATANYRKTVGNGHRFDVLAGASEQRFNRKFNDQTATGFITDAFLWNNMGSASIQLPSQSGASSNLMYSYFGRINYSYKSRYMITATLRTDGASVFAENNKWATFPSAAVAWNVAEENFFEGIRGTLSQLKLRLSYGQTGNAQITPNAFAAYSAYPAWLSANEARLIGVSLSRLANPDLKWETTTGINLGIDFAIKNGKIDGSIELFNNTVSDLLSTRYLNSYQAIDTVISNIGKTRSRGFEVTINTRNIETRDFQWRTTFVASRFKDTWVERSPDWKPAVYQSDKDPIRALYLRQSDGILQIGEKIPESQPQLKPGQIKIKDIDGFVRDEFGNPVVDANGRFQRTGQPDGIIDDADTRMVGTTDPSLMAGLSNMLTYKNWSLSFDFNALFGLYMQDPNYVNYGFSAYGISAQGYNGLRSVKDRWTPSNPSTTVPSSFWGYSPYGVGDFFYQDAWFVRLQNVSLGYNLPKSFIGKGIAAARVHFDAHNLFVITPYTGVDPETDSYTAAYPYIRTFTFGVNLTF